MVGVGAAVVMSVALMLEPSLMQQSQFQRHNTITTIWYLRPSGYRRYIDKERRLRDHSVVHTSRREDLIGLKTGQNETLQCRG